MPFTPEARTNELVSAALAYAAEGLFVLACNATTKRPRTSHGVLDASRDADVIRRWWLTDPDAAVAIRTGAVSGRVVLDIDGSDGEDSLYELERKSGPLPETTEVLTPRGRHLHFLYPPQVGLVRCAVAFRGLPGVDIRGDGGYVLVPPTPRYEFDVSGHALAVWPHALLGAEDGGYRLPKEEEAIRRGTRNAVLASLGGSMRRRGMSQAAIRAALHADNRTRCVPPLVDEEVEQIAKSVARYAPAEGVGIRHRPPSDEEVRDTST